MHTGELTPPPGAKRGRKRLGRGMGSGLGKTSGRGMKGQKAREQVRPGFEGGQTPLYRRLRKHRGISKSARNIGLFRRRYAEVNIGRLQEHFEPGALVTPELLLQRRIIRQLHDGLRILGEGEIAKALTIRAHHFTAAARAKIEAAGGSVELI